MSEVAVKIYETKRDIQRVQMVGTLHGKDGAVQTAKFVNPDTGDPVTKFVYKRVGQYELQDVILGKNVKGIHGPFDWAKGETQLSHQRTDADGHGVRSTLLFFASIADTDIPLVALEDLLADTVVEHYYAVLRYLDD